MIAGRLYKKGEDGILRLCIEPSDYPYYLLLAHQILARIHLLGQQKTQGLLRLRVFWPTMYKDAHTFVRACLQCSNITPIPHATLYQVMVAPQWNHYLVDYLQTHVFLANITLAHKKAI